MVVTLEEARLEPCEGGKTLSSLVIQSSSIPWGRTKEQHVDEREGSVLIKREM